MGPCERKSFFSDFATDVHLHIIRSFFSLLKSFFTDDLHSPKLSPGHTYLKVPARVPCKVRLVEGPWPESLVIAVMLLHTDLKSYN
jgi:hypothetical protein